MTDQELRALARRLYESCQVAVGAYEVIDLVGAGFYLPGYQHCLEELHAVIAEAKLAGVDCSPLEG